MIRWACGLAALCAAAAFCPGRDVALTCGHSERDLPFFAGPPMVASQARPWRWQGFFLSEGNPRGRA